MIIPEGVEEICSGAFYGCSNLNSIILPNSLKSIGPDSFSWCGNLEVLKIGEQITEISRSFDYTTISDVYCYASSLPQTHPNAFYNKQYSTLHVPDISIEEYKNTFPWSQFGTIVGLSESTDVSNAADISAKPTDYFTLDGQRNNAITKGVTIIKMSDGTVKKVVVK